MRKEEFSLKGTEKIKEVGMKKRKNLYIVWSEDRSGDKMIGYLPSEHVPLKSILWDALRNPGIAIRTEGGYGFAFRGIYEDYELAVAHLKIESKWRTEHGNKFQITTLESGM